MTIEVSVLGQHLQQAVFELATQVFIESSTLHRALGIRLGEYRDYLRHPFEEMVSEGLSVAAIDHDTDNIVGCLIATDLYRHMNTAGRSSGKYSPLAALTKALCDQYQRRRWVNKGEVVLVDMGAVSPVAAGKGVYQKMRGFAQRHARESEFRRIVGELSSSTTQHVVLNKLGHEKMAEVVFAEFEFDGRLPFRSIDTPRSIVLAEGIL